jgi:hypothetical protein
LAVVWLLRLMWLLGRVLGMVLGMVLGRESAVH